MALTQEQIRESFVNCSRSEAAELPLPPGMHEVDWSRREYLGWRDPRIPQRGYVVVPTENGPVGIVWIVLVPGKNASANPSRMAPTPSSSRVSRWRNMSMTSSACLRSWSEVLSQVRVDDMPLLRVELGPCLVSRACRRPPAATACPGRGA